MSNSHWKEEGIPDQSSPVPTTPHEMLRRAMLRATPARPPRLPRNPHTARRFATAPPTAQSRIDRFNRRLPKFLHKYTNALANAPLSHISSFLILHELTAVVPLFGLAGYFHYTHWLPPWFAEGAWVASGVQRFGRYFKRKGWIRSDEAAEAEREVSEIRKTHELHEEGKEEGLGKDDEAKRLRRVDRAWSVSEGGVRLVVEFATAYAIVKVLLVPRIVLSVWATPWFARWTVLPVLNRVKRGFGRGKATGGGGAVPQGGSGKRA